MGERRDDGGAAFPHTSITSFHGDSHTRTVPGLSLLDYFAGQALGSVVASLETLGSIDMRYNSDEPYPWDEGAEYIASTAYIVAAALLTEKRRREAASDE